MSPILKIDTDDEEKEIDFELDYLLSLTTDQRFQTCLNPDFTIATYCGLKNLAATFVS